MKLRAPEPANQDAVMDFRCEFLQRGERLLGAAGLENYENYFDWLKHTRSLSHEHTARPDLPPSSTFLCWMDEQLIGTVEIRHRMNEFQLQYTGQIGLSIRPSRRGQGLGTRFLALALTECRKLGLTRVLLTCSRYNESSRAAIEANGGILENETAYEGDIRCRYWITIPAARCRPLAPSELTEDLFAHFIRRQQVTMCRRRFGVSWRMVYCPFVDDWTTEQLRQQIRNLHTTRISGGMVYGAFVDGVLKGFAAISGAPMGPGNIYRDLLSLHVSADYRGRGLGRILFEAAAQWAREAGASKLYISSHSAQETQAFYAAVGCVDTRWPSPEHVALEPFDCQLEYTL